MALHKSEKTNDSINYEVLEKCGVLSKSGKNTKELRYVSWNGKEAKYDIRTWYIDDEGNERCAKGITLTGEELERLSELINKLMEMT